MVRSNSIEIIRSIVEYVENNIKENITLEDIERHVNMSTGHLHRLFKAVTNKRLIDYARNRKLSCSIHDLLYTDLNIIDIALEYGFKYEQSFIRSFKRAFNISPKRFRKDKIPLKIEDKVNINNL